MNYCKLLRDQRAAAGAMKAAPIPGRKPCEDSKNHEYWLATRDPGFKSTHLIPQMKSYDLDYFEEFIGARKQLMIERFKAI